MKMWGITNTGLVRSENQDAYAAFTVGSYSAAVVCDGMGGTNGGRIASSIAVEQFEKELRAVLQENAGEEQLRQAMLYAISLANDAIRREAAKNTDYQHMGTTLVCALAREELVMVGNIGDSRAYYITAEDIRQISRDHSVVENMVEKGDITPQERAVTPTAISSPAHWGRTHRYRPTAFLYRGGRGSSSCCVPTGWSTPSPIRRCFLRCFTTAISRAVWITCCRYRCGAAHRTISQRCC